MDKDTAVLYVTDFSPADFAKLKMSAATVKHFHPDARVLAITCGQHGGAEQQCAELGIELAECGSMFDEMFPWFNKHGCGFHWLNLVRKYPKVTFARYLAPFALSAKKVLYLDNDTVVCRKLDSIMRSSQSWMAAFDDGEASKHISNHFKDFTQLVSKHDVFKTFRRYANNGVLLMDCTAEGKKHAAKFIQRMQIAQEIAYARCQKFLSDQDCLNLFAEAETVMATLTSKSLDRISPDTCVFHYHPYKRRGDIVQLLRQHLYLRNGLDAAALDGF